MNKQQESYCFSETDSGNFDEKDNHCTTPFEYTHTNIWNSSFSAPEINCDMQILHSDLQEIKNLVKEIKNSLNNFFCVE